MASNVWNLNPNQINDDLEYAPEFVLNKQNVSTVAHKLRKELKDCKEFYFSVAFITKLGLMHLAMTLDELNKNGIKGKIITADYLNFNSPEVFEHLLRIPNIEVKCSSDKNFHPKGYIFKKDNGNYSVIVGSANLTEEGLVNNTEWNIKMNLQTDNKLLKQIQNEFDDQWNRGVEVNVDWIDKYRDIYDETKSQIVEISKEQEKRFEPNLMQKEALKNLQTLRENGINKALLISATGTGKTFLSAFDVKQAKANKVLFVVHRERILKDAKKTFEYIFGQSKSYGFLTGSHKDYYSDFIFATSDTLGKNEIFNKFNKNHFDYIIIDEAHHSAANHFEAIINYFEPKFLLGMTATPTRMDGQSIFEYFGENIAYEITLEKALEQDLLCPFRYYGISDEYLNPGQTLKNTNIDIDSLVNDKRIDFIMQKAEYYTPWNNKPQGLIFVKSKLEAKKFSEKFNQKGWKTVALDGESSDFERERAIKQLENKELDYIISVNIFNEGIDMKFVNQIIMLRETESVTVFVQQLGRGLRKYKDSQGNKDYVVILDFIGNYNNNFMIPMALTGDMSYNPENVRRKMVELEFYGSNSYVEFDQVSKEKIFNSINNVMSLKFGKEFKTSWQQLMLLLSKVPTHLDFAKYSSLFADLLILKKTTYKTYIDFLIKFQNEIKKELLTEEFKSKLIFNDIEFSYLRMIFNEIITGKSNYITNILLDICFDRFTSLNEPRFLPQFSDAFYLKNKYLNILDDEQTINLNFSKCLENKNFKDWIIDMCEYNNLIYKKEYESNGLFKIGKIYSKKEYCQLIGYEIDNTRNLGGHPHFYKDWFENNQQAAIFINYKKHDNLSNSLKYEDRFIDNQTLVWQTTNKRNLKSPSIIKFEQDIKNGLKPDLFVRKDGHESGFYYLGKVDVLLSTGEDIPVTTDDGKKTTRVQYVLHLKEPIKESIYRYITESN